MTTILPTLHQTHQTCVRSQAALVRALLDEVEHLVPGSMMHGAASGQLAEELARLGHRIIEEAASIAEDVRVPSPGSVPEDRARTMAGAAA